MRYRKFQGRMDCVMGQAQSLLARGVRAFEIYDGELLLLGVDTYTDCVWGCACEKIPGCPDPVYGDWLATHPDMFAGCKGRFPALDMDLRGWRVHWQHYRLFSLYNYVPSQCHVLARESRSRQIRELVWDFKCEQRKGRVRTDHVRAVDFFAPKVAKVLSCTLGKDIAGTLFLCVPSSTEGSYRGRNADFSAEVSRLSGITEAMGSVKYYMDGEQMHCGGKVRPVVGYDRDMFMGRNVVVFDDVITHGDTVRKCVDDVARVGGRVVGAVCLAETSFYLDAPHPYDGYEEMMSGNI